LEVLAAAYPSADFFALFADERFVPNALKGRSITTTFLDRIPGGKRVYRQLLPLYPLAVESLDLSGYDLVISADGAATKGVLTDQDSLHICYCHSPPRSFWDQYSSCSQALSWPARLLFAPISQYMRQWDYGAAQRIDGFIANSHYVAARIRKYYRRSSTVIHPPVDTDAGYLSPEREDYYLSVGRLVPEKRTDILIRACNHLGKKLRIIGTGPEDHALRKIAGPSIEFLGRVEDAELSQNYAACRALLFAADEDFGLVSVEAQTFGRPVIAYGRGGSLETVVGLCDDGAVSGPRDDGQATGIFFSEQSEISLAAAILRFEFFENRFDPEAIQRHARSFDTEVFVAKVRDYVDQQFFQRSMSAMDYGSAHGISETLSTLQAGKGGDAQLGSRIRH
jgi:glycosyltransferase involved in cell wall biosynthesis